MTAAVLPGQPRSHSLLVSESETRRRTGVARWVDDELAVGAKVVYTGRFAAGATGPESHWLAGPGGARGAREALETGQLEFFEITDVLERTGGRGVALAEGAERVARRALDEGWTRVAMSTDSPRIPVDGDAAAEVAKHEARVDQLVEELPLTVLCQVAVPEEDEAAVWERVAVHHRDLVDETWSARSRDGVWFPRGELDAYVARRFGAALNAALRGAAEPPPEDLHVDMSGVGFVDVACAQMLVLAAAGVAPGQRIVLHRPSRTTRRLVDAVGRPRAVEFSDEDPS